MLLKAGQIVQSMAPLLAQSLTGARFSKASFSTAQPKVDRNLLYPFNKDKTRLAVDSIQEYTNSLYEKDLKGLVVLDKLSQTITSDTHRVFDKCENKFFAVKTLNLDSDSSWKQLNLILRQQEENYSNLQKFSFLNYDHAGKEAKIITEIQKNVLLKDVLTPRTWETEELKNLTLQLLRQADSLKQLGAYCNYVKPEHIFADQVTQTLKLFDFSGFEIEPNNMSWGHHQPALNIDAIVFSLVKIIDPFAAVNHPEEAQIYMSRKYPEFYQELNKIKSKAEYLSSWFNMRSFEGSFHEYNQTGKNTTVFHSAEYDQLNLNKFKQLIMSEQLSNFNEVWGSVNKGFGKYGDAVSAFEKSLEENIARYGYIHENTCRSYLDLAETYKAMEKPSEALDYFKKAVNISYNMLNMDGLLTARLYNGFGDLLREQKQYIDALDCFEKAEKALKNSGVSHPSFAAKIEANLNLARKNAEPSGNVYEDFKNAWKNSSNDHHHNWQNWHNMSRDERFAAKMNWFGERMGRFGKNMEDIGERYKNFTWDHTNNTWHYKHDKHSQERWERKMERFASKMNGFGARMERFGKKMENMGEKWKNQDWEAMHSKWNSKDFFRQKHYDWWQKRMNPEKTDKTDKTEKAQEAQEASNRHHHPRSFMNCYGRGYGWHHHHHHHKGHWGWSHHSFGSWNKPPGCGFFYRTRRFFRVMFKIMFYSFCFVLFCKLWRKAVKGPSDRSCDPSYQMNGPSVGPIQNDERKDRWSSWHREWHAKYDQQNDQMNQMNGNDERKGWWHRHHHCKKNDQQNDQVNQMNNNNNDEKKGWWASWHDKYHRRCDQQNDQVNGNEEKNEKKGWWHRHHHCKKSKDQQNESEVSGQEPERRRRHSAAPVMTQEQGVQTEDQNQDMRHHRRGFEQFRRRYGENFDQKEYEDAMKKFEEFSDRREKMRQARHSRARSEENVPNVAQVTEVVGENPEQNRTTFVQQPSNVSEVKKQDFVEKKVEFRQNAPLPVRKTEENIKVSNAASEMSKDLPAQERSNSWLAFGFFALVSTLGLSL